MKKILIFLFFCVCQCVLQAQTLLPMPQTFTIVSGTTVSDTFLVAAPSTQIIVTGIDVNQLSLILPDGTVVNSANATSIGWTWLGETNDVGELFVNIGSQNAAIGQYGFELTAAATQNATFAVIQNPGLSFVPIVGSPGQALAPNQPFALALILYYQGSPVDGAVVSVDIIDRATGLVVQTIEPLDTGVSPDATLSDGIYTTVTTIANAGEYEALFNTAWASYGGRVAFPFRIAAASLELDRTFVSTGIDIDADGLIEELQFVFGEAIPRVAGNYEITAQVTDVDGNAVTATDRVANVLDPLSVMFQIDTLSQLAGQPWQLSSVNVWEGARVIGVWEDLGEVLVDTGSFERDPLLIQGIDADRGIDADTNDLFDTLEVDVLIDTIVGGSYGYSADLRTVDGELIGSVGASAIGLTEGMNTLTLMFSGSEIGASGQDGPYFLTNFLIFPNFTSNERLAALVDSVDQTSFYSASSFENFIPNVECSVVGEGTLKLSGKKVEWKLSNMTDKTVALTALTISWPTANGVLEEVKLNGKISDSTYQPTSATIDAWIGDQKKREIKPGKTKKLSFKFTEKVDESQPNEYQIQATFDDTCVAPLVLGVPQIQEREFKIKGSSIEWKLENNGEGPGTISQLSIEWPEQLGALEEVELNGKIFDGSIPAPNAIIDTQWVGSAKHRQIKVGNEKKLKIKFGESATGLKREDFNITLQFSEGAGIALNN